MCHRQKKLLKFHWELAHFIIQILMDLFDFNVPFWVTIGRTKTFHREGEKLVGQKGSNNGKTCLLGEACSAFSLPRPSTTIKMNSNCFLPYKTHSLPENEHYYMFVMFWTLLVQSTCVWPISVTIFIQVFHLCTILSV